MLASLRDGIFTLGAGTGTGSKVPSPFLGTKHESQSV
jgi:hypothetical protein